MLFPTIEYFIFFIIVFFLNWGTYAKLNIRNILLILASLFFYGFWDYRFVGLILISSITNYGIILLLFKYNKLITRKFYLILACILNFGILAFFKYYTFLLVSLENTFHYFNQSVNLPYIQGIILPVGISFFTFQIMSLVIDVYTGKITKLYSLTEVILYICFFPQLVAGPIVRAEEFLPQLETPRDPNKIDSSRAFILIGFGLFKKVLIANYISVLLVDPVYENPGFYSVPNLFLAIYGYSIQIYCDFSAYSDIAIGTALLLGFNFPDNFNSPYRADSLQDFWRRWHISLSGWLRDYLYIPLGGSKNGKFNTYKNLMITMLLGGLWHGAAWSFVIWGGLHGMMLSAERILAKLNFKVPKIIKIIFTFHFVSFCWIFFRAGSWEKTVEFFSAFKTTNSEIDFINPFAVSVLVLGFITHYIPEKWENKVHSIAELSPILRGIVFTLLLIILAAVSGEGVPPFIYFQF
ncbi:MAG: MBOAT family protein [Leptospiraceae bacterium]|nr:MBOAT family protein [Leptospiraceae bacterium]